MDVNIILLFIMIPALVRARIIHNIYFDKPAGNYSVELDGWSEDFISDDDIRAFMMTDSNLKDGVRVLLGKPPNDVFVRSPKPWNDLYPKYEWSEVTTKLEPVEYTVKEVVYRPVVVYRQIYVNNSTSPVVHSVGASQTLEQPVATTWSRNQEVSDNEVILYLISVVNGVRRCSFLSQWGKNDMVNKILTVGTSEDVQVTVNPGQAIVTELRISRGNANIDVNYRSTLNGSIAAYFDPKYRPQNYATSDQFFSLDVNDVMGAANLPRVFNFSETVSLTFYSEAKVTVHDHATGSRLLEVPVEVALKDGANIEPMYNLTNYISHRRY